MLASLGQTRHQHLRELNTDMDGSAKYLPLDSFLPRMPNLQYLSMVSTDFMNSELSTRALCHWMPQLKSVRIISNANLDLFTKEKNTLSTTSYWVTTTRDN